MPADERGMLTREELLGGLPARRASALLFAVESRTAHLVARSRQAMATFATERTAAERERAFLEAFAHGREPPVRPTIQDLERYAPEWASLVPPDPSLRAALARMIGAKYPVPANRVPGITAALGLADPAVGERFQALHNAPITSIFAAGLPWRERWRWLRTAASARLENLPPFWTAFALTLTETIGAGLLALPIALATVGPVAGLISLAVLGLVNMLTIAAMAEAVARNGNVRYGRAYFGRMVRDYLGSAGTLILTPALLLLNVVSLLAYFIGFSSALADATGARAEVWAAGLFLVLLTFLRRRNLSATVASALLVGAMSIVLVIILSLIALPHVTEANLRHAEIPFRNGRPFDSSVLELIFGVVLLAFFGHTTTANCAAVVLAKDPSARSLIRGSVIAMGTGLGLYGLWVIAVNGAVPAAALASESGTALGPLAAQVGSGVHVFGVIFVVLAMGMASIHMSLGLSYQVREWLPAGDASPPTGEVVGAGPPSGLLATLRRAATGPRWRGSAVLAPVVAIFLLVESLFLANRESFAGPLGFLGVVTAPIIAGIFSTLMLVAARRKGDCAVGEGRRFLGHPIVVAGVCLVFLASIVVHGLVVWDDPLRRSVAMLVSVAIVGCVVAARRTAFVPRAVVELRLSEEPRAEPVVNVVARGAPIPADVTWSGDGHARLGRTGNGRNALIRVQALPVRELKVWVHRLTPDGVTEGVPARVDILGGNERHEVDLGPLGGQVVVPTDGSARRVAITHLGDGRPAGLR